MKHSKFNLYKLVKKLTSSSIETGLMDRYLTAKKRTFKQNLSAADLNEAAISVVSICEHELKKFLKELKQTINEANNIDKEIYKAHSYLNKR